MEPIFLTLGAAFGGLGVALGAFGAHGLRDRLAPNMLANYETGVRYQIYHALALLAVTWATGRWPTSGLAVAAGWLFVAGIVLFSFSLYALAVSGVRRLGAITPVGGVALVAGWICLLLTPWTG